MLPVRHKCNARLFDSRFEVLAIDGPSPDLSVKCHRCTRAQKEAVIVGYRLKLPRSSPHIAPEPIYCQNVNCLARLCNLGLSYTLCEDGGDIAIACHRCGEITRIALSGVYEVA